MLPLPSASASRNVAARALRLLKLRSLLCKRWILEGQSFARLQSLGNQNFIAALPRYFYRGFFELRSPPHVGHRSPSFSEKGVCRNHNSVGDASNGDANGCSHSGRKPRIASC